jgi:hypothetical protein
MKSSRKRNPHTSLCFVFCNWISKTPRHPADDLCSIWCKNKIILEPRVKGDGFLVAGASSTALYVVTVSFSKGDAANKDIKSTEERAIRSKAGGWDVGLVKGTPHTTDCRTRPAVRGLEQTFGGLRQTRLTAKSTKVSHPRSERQLLYKARQEP